MKKILFGSAILFLGLTSCDKHSKFDKDNSLCHTDSYESVIPDNVTHVVIKDGNGTIHITQAEETSYTYPGYWIFEEGYNKFEVQGNTLYIWNTFSDSHIKLKNFTHLEILDMNSTTYVSPTFTEEGHMRFDIGGNSSVYFDEFACHEEGTGEDIYDDSDDNDDDDCSGCRGTGIFNADVNITQNGTFHGYPIELEDVLTHVTGNGTAKLRVNGKLEGSIPSNGTIKYKGQPTINLSIGFQGTLIDDN